MHKSEFNFLFNKQFCFNFCFNEKNSQFIDNKVIYKISNKYNNILCWSINLEGIFI